MTCGDDLGAYTETIIRAIYERTGRHVMHTEDDTMYDISCTRNAHGMPMECARRVAQNAHIVSIVHRYHFGSAPQLSRKRSKNTSKMLT